MLIFQNAYQQVSQATQTPLAHGDGEASGPRHYHPYTMLVSLPPWYPTERQMTEK